ncbi:non-heme chloroperoxidase [Marininema mesophilum]|uniref:Non-heme chloroperoxidase n=1 Tax=Marininema mesophilum TaxID=1048340 RepID=A0A1H3CW36_9BACL|nr:alpha/beta hydrolase [Marininema mesophilum]SDX58335.1 non-heme chloroperoxidase [Marininema mesophilum]
MGYYIAVEEKVRIFVEDIDPGQGKPVLFIHGWPLNHKMFEYQFNHFLQMGYRCIAIDLRGFGKSDRSWNGYSYNRLADDIRIVIDTLGLENITLIGFSVGGAISIRYMARHGGHQVSKLALLGAAAPAFTKRAGFPYGLTKAEVNKLIEGTYKDRPKMLVNFGDMLFARYVSDECKAWIHGLGMEAFGHATAMLAISLRDEDLRQDLPTIQVPTIILHGKQEKICPFPLGEAMKAGIQGSKLIPMKYSGHGLFYCEQEKLNAELFQFIGSSI